MLPGVPPSALIDMVQEESIAIPRPRVHDWGQGRSPHPKNKILPGVPPNFPLLKKIWSRSLLWEVWEFSLSPPPPLCP